MSTCWKRWGRPLIRMAVLSGCLLLMAWLLLPKPELYPSELTWSRIVKDRHGAVLHVSTTTDGRYRIRTALEEINPVMIRATLEKEDRWYYRHPGVNPLSLCRSVWGVMSGQAKGGASTLTMQVARMRWGLKTRSVGGKFTQIYRALQLERHYSKDQILEAYFNLAPYGGNVEGISAASLLWCGHSAKELSDREAFALGIIPQSPATRSPARHDDRNRIAQSQARLLSGMEPSSTLRDDPLAASFTLVPPAEPPHAAPHLCRRLMSESKAPVIESTIDLAMQQTLEEGIKSYLDRSSEFGINNACAVLVHAPSRSVRAYVGSGNYEDRSIQGMVDGLKARRSPGSALKPFVYGLAVEQGLIHAQSLLVDGPMNFGNYNPENYEGDFLGPVSAREALLRSRNIPAVDLARRLKGDGLYGLLKRGGVELKNNEAYYGLSIALGGAGVTPLELARLYAALADDGVARPLVLEQDQVAEAVNFQEPPLLGTAARYIVLDMMKGQGNLGVEYAFVRGDSSIAWKTGTSHGFRDAWAAGVKGEYVLIVWMGNFNGRGNNALIARRCAAPLLFDLYARLPLQDHSRGIPSTVSEVEVCALSGCLPGQHCPHTTRTLFVPGVSPIRMCEIHREILLDGATGARVAWDDGRTGLRRAVYEFWSPEMLSLFKRAGLPRREPPAPEGVVVAVDGLDPGEAPVITSPLAGRVYLVGDTTESGAITLKSRPAAGVSSVYWFCDETFLGRANAGEGFSWTPSPGAREIRVLDDHGRSANLTVTVRQQ